MREEKISLSASLLCLIDGTLKSMTTTINRRLDLIYSQFSRITYLGGVQLQLSLRSLVRVLPAKWNILKIEVPDSVLSSKSSPSDVLNRADESPFGSLTQTKYRMNESPITS